MKSRNKIFMAGALGLILAATGVAAVHAQSGTGTNPMSSLVSAIATKFNLNVSDVQKVVDDQMASERAAREAEQEQNFTTKVNAALTAGTITQDQANKILAEHATLKSALDGLTSLTPSERETQMKTIMDTAKQWAKDNNISPEYIFPGFGRGPGKGMRGRHGSSN